MFALRIPLLASSLAFLLCAPAAAQYVEATRVPAPAPAPDGPESPPEEPPASPSGAAQTGSATRTGVYLHSGEVHLAALDLHIAGRGLDFVWARRYRSRWGRDTALGQGWSHSYDVRVESEGPGLRLFDGNGRDDLYLPRAGGLYAAEEFAREGAFDAFGRFVLTFADGGTWTFLPLDGAPAAGRLTTLADRNGNALALAYDGAGRLAEITDTLGRSITVQYGAGGRIASVTDFVGRQVSYAHYLGGEAGGSAGDLKSVTTPSVEGTPTGNDFPSGKTSTYTYTEGFADARLDHNLIAVVDPGGTLRWSHVYHPTQDPQDVNFDRVMQRSHAGGEIQYVYVPLPGTFPPDPIQPVLRTIVNDALGNVSEWRFDPRGRLVSERRFSGRANPRVPTTELGNRPQNPLRASDPVFFERRHEYNADGRITRTEHPNGNVTERVHELELDPSAAWRTRFNLRELRRSPGTHLPLGEQSEIVDGFEYEPGTDRVVRHLDGRGHETTHLYDAAGNRTRTVHRISSAVEDWEYDGHGRLVRRSDPPAAGGLRRVDEFVYHPDGSGPQAGYLAELHQDVNGAALVTHFETDALGNVLRIQRPSGHEVLRDYNELGQLVRQSHPRPVSQGGGLYAQTDFHYDATDNLVQRDELNVNWVGTVGSNTHFSTWFEYGPRDELLRLSREVEVGRAVVTEYGYDGNGNRTLERSGEAVNGNAPASTVHLVFDERDLPFREVRAQGSPSQSTTQWDYDGNGNPIRVSSGLEDGARVREVVYDAYDRALEALDPLGNLTQHRYDANGNRTGELVLGELFDGPGSASNVRLNEVERSYDPMDRPVSVTEEHFRPTNQAPIGDGQSLTTIEYDDRSLVTRVVDDNGRATTWSYDGLGRLALVMDSKLNNLTYTYDADSNPITVREQDQNDLGGHGLNYFTHFAYDGMARPTSLTDPLGSTQYFGYDSAGNRTVTFDALANGTNTEYDGLGRPIRTTHALTDDGSGGGQPLGEIVLATVWDDDSRVSARSDGEGNVTTYAYDELDRLVAIGYADGSLRSASYDAHGDRLETLDPNGTRVVTLHDGLGRPSQRAVVPGMGVSHDTTFESYGFDGLSRIVAGLDDDSSLVRSYDSLSNLIQEHQNGEQVEYTHDGVGNRLSALSPSGLSVTYAYDGLNRVRSVSSCVQVNYEYIGRNRMARRTFLGGICYPPDPIRTAYGYDAGRRVGAVGSVRLAGPAAILDLWAYQWDVIGNRIGHADARNGGPLWTQDLAYDSRYRLVSSEVHSESGDLLRSTGYGLDRAGNRTQVLGTLDPGTYAMNLPAGDAALNQYSSTPFDLRTYDANGNWIGQVLLSSGAVRSMVYDHRDQLVEHIGAAQARYAYDVFGRRIRKTVLGGGADEETQFLYHGWEVCEERDGNGSTLATFVHGAQLDEVLVMEREAEPTLFLSDAAGDVTAVLHATGQVLERYRYGDFGQPSFYDAQDVELPSSAVGNPYLYRGRRYDPESGLLYFRSRHLDPRSGRFLSRARGGIWSDGQNLGVGTVYAGNNPGSKWLPFGGTSQTQSARAASTFAGRLDGAAGFGISMDLRSFHPTPAPAAAGFVSPLSMRGFNPQPEPPAAGFVHPANLRGFNPQPEPPAAGFVSPLSMRGFNPQPEPPGAAWLGGFGN